MINVYIAAPMFSYAELKFNEQVAGVLEENAFNVFLPQRSGFKLIELLKTMSPNEARYKIFQKDILEVKKSDVVIIILDGRTIDEGACVELGYAYGLNKSCYGLKTDPRTMIDGQINPMISECLNGIYKSIDELVIKLKDEYC